MRMVHGSPIGEALLQRLVQRQVPEQRHPDEPADRQAARHEVRGEHRRGEGAQLVGLERDPPPRRGRVGAAGDPERHQHDGDVDQERRPGQPDGRSAPVGEEHDHQQHAGRARQQRRPARHVRDVPGDQEVERHPDRVEAAGPQRPAPGIARLMSILRRLGNHCGACSAGVASSSSDVSATSETGLPTTSASPRRRASTTSGCDAAWPVRNTMRPS